MKNITFFSSFKGISHFTNEDKLYIGHHIIIVADGMGGTSMGEMASTLAIESLSSLDVDFQGISIEEIKRIIIEAFYEADEEIRKYSNLNPDARGLGTTALIYLKLKEGCLIAWCGDSRCYSFGRGILTLLTKDHSYVQQLVNDGIVSKEESIYHPDNSLITKYLGGGVSMCEPDIIIFDQTDVDMFVLCTDGLTGYCSDSKISCVIKENEDLGLLPQELRQLALREGSDDDITIVVLSTNRGSCCIVVIKKWMKSVISKMKRFIHRLF